MGEIRFVGTGETRGYPYPVCKKFISNYSTDWKTPSYSRIKMVYECTGKVTALFLAFELGSAARLANC